MGKECNEIGKDLIGRSKMTKASPRCSLKFLKKMNRRSRKMNRPFKRLKNRFREVISRDKNVETNMNVDRSMGNSRPLVEFNQSDWIQVDFAPIINYRRKEEYRHVAKRVEDIFDQEMSGESIQNIFEKEDEEDEGWIDRYDISKIYD
jgi:hypothetical protein